MSARTPKVERGAVEVRKTRYAYWMARSGRRRNDALLAKMLSSWEAGVGALPARLGLAQEPFHALLSTHFPGAVPERGSATVQLADDREGERIDLVTLLNAHRAGVEPSELWMAEIVAAACMGDDHLWQDLGLWSRVDLGRLMDDNFPALARRNVYDMKWKRFLYKQLCQAEGVYVCRAPSCEVCVDYAKCFGAED